VTRKPDIVICAWQCADGGSSKQLPDAKADKGVGSVPSCGARIMSSRFAEDRPSSLPTVRGVRPSFSEG